jgi:Cu/Ag efflux pump CusA
VVVARTVTPALSLILLPRAPLERRETPPSTIDGTSDLHVELQDEIPHIRVTPDLAPAGRYGLTPGWRVRRCRSQRCRSRSSAACSPRTRAAA